MDASIEKSQHPTMLPNQKHHFDHLLLSSYYFDYPFFDKLKEDLSIKEPMSMAEALMKDKELNLYFILTLITDVKSKRKHLRYLTNNKPVLFSELFKRGSQDKTNTFVTSYKIESRVQDSQFTSTTVPDNRNIT